MGCTTSGYAATSVTVKPSGTRIAFTAWSGGRGAGVGSAAIKRVPVMSTRTRKDFPINQGSSNAPGAKVVDEVPDKRIQEAEGNGDKLPKGRRRSRQGVRQVHSATQPARILRYAARASS